MPYKLLSFLVYHMKIRYEIYTVLLVKLPYIELVHTNGLASDFTFNDQ